MNFGEGDDAVAGAFVNGVVANVDVLAAAGLAIIEIAPELSICRVVASRGLFERKKGVG